MCGLAAIFTLAKWSSWLTAKRCWSSDRFEVNLGDVLAFDKDAVTARIAIRFASTPDLPCLTALFDAYRMFYGLASDRAAAAAFLAARLQHNESVVLVGVLAEPASGAEAIVGFAQLYRGFSSLALGTVIVLNDLYVASSARRLGVGGRLVDAATDYAKQVGAIRVSLETRPDNAEALRLYRAKGFVPDDEYAHLSIACGASTLGDP